MTEREKQSGEKRNIQGKAELKDKVADTKATRATASVRGRDPQAAFNPSAQTNLTSASRPGPGDPSNEMCSLRRACIRMTSRKVDHVELAPSIAGSSSRDKVLGRP